MGQRQSEIIKNHMEVYWHDCASASKGVPITEAGLVEKASVIGRTGLMLLECGTGAWRVRSSMNTLSRELGVTTTADIGLLSIEFTCFDGDQCYTQSLCLTNTGVNTSRLNRLEHFVNDFDREGKFMTGEELHSHLDEIDAATLVFAHRTGLCSCTGLRLLHLSAWRRHCGNAVCLLRCRHRQLCTVQADKAPFHPVSGHYGVECHDPSRHGCHQNDEDGVGQTFQPGAHIQLGKVDAAGNERKARNNFVRCKLTKHHFTLFLGITASVCSASLVYAILLKPAEVLLPYRRSTRRGISAPCSSSVPGLSVHLPAASDLDQAGYARPGWNVWPTPSSSFWWQP